MSTTTIQHQTNRILVPVELNETGENLLDYAGQLARVLGAELYLFHACKTADLTYTQQSSCIQKLRSFAERVFSREIKTANCSVPFDCIVRSGQIQDSIQAIVQDYQIDLVLIDAVSRTNEGGNRQATELAGIVMDLVSCPVMVLPAAVRYKKLKNLVLATDFTDQDHKVLTQIADLAHQLRVKLTLVQVYSKEERSQLSAYKAAMLQLQNQLKGRKVAFKMLEEEDVLEGISEFSEQDSADMLVLATQDNFLMDRLFSTNYMKTLAFHTRIPLLTYRQHKKKPCSGCCANCTSKLRQMQLQSIN